MSITRTILLCGILLPIILISGCIDQNGGGIQIPPTASLSVKLVHIISPTDYVVIEGAVPIDLNNISWSWIKEDEKIDERIKENYPFVSRFELNYPHGLLPYDDLTLLIKASAKKIESIGIITRGYPFMGTKKSTLMDEEIIIYKYNFGQIKEGTTQSIIFAGETGKIGISFEDKTPIYVSLITKDGEEIASGHVDIPIYREEE